ncbi:MAG: DUF6402 family protein [Paucimonas sp.]|jgi:hypothetical protein|nr:DUF6402 family protein [Paucimonas sp.]
MSLNDFEQTNALGPETLFTLPNATLETAPGKDHPPKKIMINRLALTRLPGAMRNMGWETAAALMQRWFDSPAWAMPNEWKEYETQPGSMSLSAAHCDDQIVKMEWAMQFESCRNAIRIAESRIETPKAISLLKKRLKAAGWVPNAPFDLGFFGMNSLQMDSISQVNIAEFGESSDTLDDLYGALGRATLKVGVVGIAYSEKDTATGVYYHYFRTSHIGFYIRDNYDFNGPQYLGTWTKNRVLTKAETILSLTPAGQSIIHIGSEPFAAISNPDFRAYRKKTGMGGDFVIYSDVMWRKHERIISLGDLS